MLPLGEVPAVIVEYPPESRQGPRGDYASPVALTLAKTWGKDPMRVAEAIVAHLSLPPCAEKVVVAPPGFLNVRLSRAWLSKKLDDILREKRDLGRSDLGQGKGINLEFVSGNPTGEIHMGNARALFTADVLGNVLAHAGYAVTREYYVNDMGGQVSKYGESVLRRILQAAGYAVEYPPELYQGAEVSAVAASLQEELKEDLRHAWTPDDLANADLREEVTRRAIEASVREARRLLSEVARVRYDVWFRESNLYASGAVAGVLDQLKKLGHAVEREGAIWFTSTAFGDDKDRVLVKSDGGGTYLLSDIAYHRDKLRRGYEIVVDFWGEDQYARSIPLRAALRSLGEDSQRLRFVLVHLVRIVRAGEMKKVSKRAGTAVPLREVLESVGVSAARFFLAMKPLSSPFDFDLDLAAAQKEENPVYYAQYAAVRLLSLFRKAKERNLLDDSLLSAWQAQPVTLNHDTEVRLMALLLRFPEVIQDVARTWEVQRLPQYVLEVAKAVHRFYDSVPVLQAPEGDLLRGRLVLARAADAVLEKCFELLGVERPEVM